MELVVVFKVADQTEALAIANSLQQYSLGNSAGSRLAALLNGTPIVAISTHVVKGK